MWQAGARLAQPQRGCRDLGSIAIRAARRVELCVPRATVAARLRTLGESSRIVPRSIRAANAELHALPVGVHVSIEEIVNASNAGAMADPVGDEQHPAARCGCVREVRGLDDRLHDGGANQTMGGTAMMKRFATRCVTVLVVSGVLPLILLACNGYD